MYPTPPSFINKSANDAGGRALQLSTDQARSAGQLVGYSLDTCFQLISIGIAAATITAQRLHARDTDGEFGQSLAPGTAEAIRNDHGDRNARPLLQSPSQVRCGTVGILGKQKRCLSSVHV